jgi:hypothetical protein
MRAAHWRSGHSRVIATQVCLGILSFLLGSVGRTAAGEPPTKPVSLYDAIEAAVAAGRLEQTRMLGFGITRIAFREVVPECAILVGFDLGLGKFMDIDSVYAIRPVYRSAQGETSYGEYGLFTNKRVPGTTKRIKSEVTHTVRVRAQKGFAVGGLTIRSGLNINGLSVTFHRISGTSLDPRQAYTSEWVGDRTGGSEASLSSKGAPVVGVFGNQ